MDRQVNVDVVVAAAAAAAAAAAFCIFFVSFPVLISACDNSTDSTGSIVTGNITDGLCSQVIQPLGYICSEHIVRTL